MTPWSRSLFVRSFSPALLLQAWNWCLYSGALAVFFNLLAPWGIPLRISHEEPPKPCSSAVAPPSPGVSHASAPVARTRLSLTGARARYGQPGVVFLDARPHADYLRGHITGAYSFDANDFSARAGTLLPLLNGFPEIIAYCSGGACEDSRELAEHLEQAGVPGVKVYEDGLGAWKDAGLPVRRGDQP